MRVYTPQNIDTFKEEYHLNNQEESLDEARDMMKRKPVKQNRPSIIIPSELLDDEDEQAEQIAEQIANKYGLIYIDQSCIGCSDDNGLSALKKAQEECSHYMKVTKIKKPYSPSKKLKWLFIHNI